MNNLLEELLKEIEVKEMDQTPVPMRIGYKPPVAAKPMPKPMPPPMEYPESAPKREDVVSIVDSPIVEVEEPELPPSRLRTNPPVLENPKVQEYMMKKMMPQAQAASPEAQAPEADPSLNKLGYALQSVGAGFLGRDPAEPVRRYQQDLNALKKDKSDRASTARKNKMEDVLFSRKQKEFDKEDAGDIPDSEISMRKRKIIETGFPSVAKAYGQDWDQVTANDMKDIVDIQKVKEQIEYRKQQLDYMNGGKAQDRELKEKGLALQNEKLAADINDSNLDRALKREELNYKKSKPSEEHLPLDAKGQIQKLSGATGNKKSLAGQINAYMKDWDTSSEAQKVNIGRQLLKVLNSSEGSDAVGEGERKNLGAMLEFAYGNFRNDNPTQFGRDLKGFKEQAMATAKALQGAAEANESEIENIYRKNGFNREGGTTTPPAPAQHPAGFPKVLRRGTKEIDVSNEEELNEAISEGWR